MANASIAHRPKSMIHTPAVAADPPTPGILAEVSTAMTALEALHESIGAIENRLGPILGPDEPSPAPVGVPDGDGLLETLTRLNAVIAVATVRITKIRSRVQL